MTSAAYPIISAYKADNCYRKIDGFSSKPSSITLPSKSLNIWLPKILRPSLSFSSQVDTNSGFSKSIYTFIESFVKLMNLNTKFRS